MAEKNKEAWIGTHFVWVFEYRVLVRRVRGVDYGWP